MNLRVSSWAIRRPLLPLLVLFGLLVTGLVDYSKLPINNLPNVQIPLVNVSIILPGATATEIETQITKRVEAHLASIQNIKHINSIVTDSISSTQIEFQLGTDIEQALAKIRAAIATVKTQLPRGVEEPNIQYIDADTTPMLTLTASSKQRSLAEISWLVDNQIAGKLLAINGVGKVQRQGGESREIQVMLDPAKLLLYGVTAEFVNEQLRQTIATLPAGRIDNDHAQSQQLPSQEIENSQEILIRTTAAPHDIDALARTKINLQNGRHARLSDLGTVSDGVHQTRQLARLNHQPVVAFAIYRTPTASEVSTEKAITTALQELKTIYQDIEFTYIQSTVENTKQIYHAALWSFFEGALLAAAVVFVFLRSWRTTWIAGLVIPLSVIPTFIVMKWLGFSLNMVSLLGLSLVSGILVDDAIVEIENITRHLKMGKSPYTAAIDAADEIGLVVVATSAVIVGIFIPVSFMGGVVGQYFKQFGITVAVATVFSLIVARFITPILAAYFLKPIHLEIKSEPAFITLWLAPYLELLKKSLKHRALTVLIGSVLLLFSFGMANLLATDFLPAEDKSQSILQIELAPGSRLADTDAMVGKITELLLHQPEVKTVYALIGGTDNETNIEGEVRFATLTISLKPQNQRALGLKAFEQAMQIQFNQMPDVHIGFLNEAGNKAISLGLSSDNPILLQRTAVLIQQEMQGLAHLTNISSTAPLLRNELNITPRNSDAARLGVSAESIADTVRIATIGEQNLNLAQINLDGRQIPVRVLLKNNQALATDFIQHLLVPSNINDTNGSNNLNQMVPLSAVADVSLSAGVTSIARYDQKRQIKLEADLNNSSLGTALTAINNLPTVRNLPIGVSRFDTGDAELLNDMFSAFSMAILAGVLMVFTILAWLFRKILQPITIMLALPFSVGGAFIALLLSQSALSLPALIGILMLMGIVGKNGILLVDFMIVHRAAGMSRQQAIIEACQQRAQPIIMTTLAMIFGMLPVIFGIGAGTAFRTPMALAVIGGLTTSTLLSLIFIPVIYTYMDDFEIWITPKLKKLTTL